MTDRLPPRQHVLTSEYHYWVTDDRGVRHDLGSLVSELLSLRRNRTAIRATEPPHPSRNPLRHRWPADHSVQTGMEAGIKLAVLRLCGAKAVGAFSAHIEEIERALDGTEDVDRH